MLRKITFGLLGLLIAVSAWAQVPNFDYPYWIYNSEGRIVEGNYYDIPEVGDWDDDGDLDLMLGVFYSGNIYYYENISTGDIPEYADHVVVTADGSPISVTYG